MRCSSLQSKQPWKLEMLKQFEDLVNLLFVRNSCWGRLGPYDYLSIYIFLHARAIGGYLISAAEHGTKYLVHP